MATGCMDMLHWTLKLMEEEGYTQPSNLEQILSFVPFRPKMLATSLHKMNQWFPLRFKEKLTVTFDEKTGSLLSVLCYANANISDAEIWEFLVNQIEIGEDDLFMGLKPIQHAIKHKNTESIEALLSFENILYWKKLETIELGYYQ